ncbi:Uncharacterised protein [uncultured archaeon]|nr:Uncharacterised protein [uncultured archaeon]
MNNEEFTKRRLNEQLPKRLVGKVVWLRTFFGRYRMMLVYRTSWSTRYGRRAKLVNNYWIRHVVLATEEESAAYFLGK